MTNDDIIYNEVNAKYHTPEQRRAILALAYTPEQIAAKGKEIHFKDVPEEQQGQRREDGQKKKARADGAACAAALAFGLHWRHWFRRGASRCRWWG